MKKDTTNSSKNTTSVLTALDYYNRACKREAIRDYPHAIQDLDKAINDDPENVDFLAKRGTLRFRHLGNFAALIDFENVLQLDPKHEEANLDFNFIYSKIHRKKEKKEIYENTIDNDIKTRALFEKRGLMKLESQSYLEALAIFHKAIKINPSVSEDYYEFSHAKKLQENGKESDEATGSNYKSTNHIIDLLSSYALLFFEEQKYELTTLFCTQILSLDPDKLDILYLKGEANFELERYSEAINDFSLLVHLNPRSVLPYLKRGSAKMKLKNRYSAFIDFRKALKLDTEYFDLYFEKINSEIKADEFIDDMKFYMRHIQTNN